MEAVEEYRKVIALDEQNAVALNNLAFLLAEYAKQPDEALKLAEKARELQETSNILDTLGWIFYRKGLYTTAIQNLELAVSKEATATRKCHLGMAYFKSGDRQRGRKLIDEASLDPQFKQSRLFQEAAQLQ